MAINIKKSKRGSFTRIAKSRGQSVSKAASELSHSDNEALRKKAQFALNAKSWSHKKNK